MDPFTRRQLLRLSTDFYRAHAPGFDASRGHQPWPGWERILPLLPDPTPDEPLRVLDVGCGNARLARFLHDAGFALAYRGVDANAALLAAARERLPDELATCVELIEADFLAPLDHGEDGEANAGPGAALPRGPFDLIALFGVLHHVPGRDWRSQLVAALAERLAPGGVLALAAWQFAGRERFARRSVAWADLDPVLGSVVEPAELEDGDTLLRFGNDPTLPPRYCHQVSDEEMQHLGADPGLDPLADFLADGAEGDLNRYKILRSK